MWRCLWWRDWPDLKNTTNHDDWPDLINTTNHDDWPELIKIKRSE